VRELSQEADPWSAQTEGRQAGSLYMDEADGEVWVSLGLPRAWGSAGRGTGRFFYAPLALNGRMRGWAWGPG
jgi:hypothetical protein